MVNIPFLGNETWGCFCCSRVTAVNLMFFGINKNCYGNILKEPHDIGVFPKKSFLFFLKDKKGTWDMKLLPRSSHRCSNVSMVFDLHGIHNSYKVEGVWRELALSNLIDPPLLLIMTKNHGKNLFWEVSVWYP